MEPFIAREVIYEWNADHALTQKRVLLPLKASTESAGCDLLIAFFCSSQSNPDDQAAHEAEVEIEKQLSTGRPVLIYFSEARASFNGARARQEQALAQYQKQYESRAVFASFADEKEFRARLAQDLARVLETHSSFRPGGACSTGGAAAVPVAPLPGEELSDHARTLLSEACEDFEAYIGRTKVSGMLRLQANGKQLVENNEPATIARWESAFNEILSGGYIRDAGCNGQLFQISAKGFEFLKSIGKTPVGYIVELGSV